MNPMNTAPHNKEILIYARWGWGSFNPKAPYEWRVASHDPEYNTLDTYNDEGVPYFEAITNNPYKDYSCDAQGWLSLPETT